MVHGVKCRRKVEQGDDRGGGGSSNLNFLCDDKEGSVR